MDEGCRAIAFLSNRSSVINAIKQIISLGPDSKIYICGPGIRHIFEQAVEDMPDEKNNSRVFIIVPSLTEKDYLGSSFYHRFNRLSARIRVNNKAVHNIISTSKGFILLSMHYKNQNEHFISGVLVCESQEAKKVMNYCEGLWNKSLPLHLEKTKA